MYAIKDKSWRAINTSDDLRDGETLSATVPETTYELRLSPSQQIILANGEDAARIFISGEPSSVVDFTINNSPQSIMLDAGGQEVIELTSDVPGTTIVIQAVTAQAVIYAVEVPS